MADLIGYVDSKTQEQRYKITDINGEELTAMRAALAAYGIVLPSEHPERSLVEDFADRLWGKG